MGALISGHLVQKSIAIHLHPCSLVLFPQNTSSILFCGICIANSLVYLVTFDNIMWKLENRSCYDQPDSVPLMISLERMYGHSYAVQNSLHYTSAVYDLHQTNIGNFITSRTLKIFTTLRFERSDIQRIELFNFFSLELAL